MNIVEKMEKKKIEEAIQKYLDVHGYERMAVKAAMFDMDGVLFDSMKNHAKCWHETMAHFGMDLPEWEAYMHEGRTGAGTINLVSIRDRGCQATEEDIQNIYKYKSDLFNQCPKAERMPGAYELLAKVKASGVVPMVVTGSGQMTLLDRLNRNFPEIFRKELMVTAFDVKYGKPNPEPYLMALRKAGLLPNEAVVVENAPLGIQAAKAAGLFTIAVNTGPLPTEVLVNAGADMVYPSMDSLASGWKEFSSLLL